MCSGFVFVCAFLFYASLYVCLSLCLLDCLYVFVFPLWGCVPSLSLSLFVCLCFFFAYASLYVCLSLYLLDCLYVFVVPLWGCVLGLFLSLFICLCFLFVNASLMFVIVIVYVCNCLIVCLCSLSPPFHTNPYLRLCFVGNVQLNASLSYVFDGRLRWKNGAIFAKNLMSSGHTASNWGNYTLNQQLPTYLSNVLRFDFWFQCIVAFVC